MPELKIQTGDGTVVPGKDAAQQVQEEQRAKMEQSSMLFTSDPHQQDVGPDYIYSKIRIRRKDEVNIYAAQQDARYAMDPRLKKLIIVAVLCVVVFVLACVLPTQLYHRAQMSFAIWLSELAQGFQNFVSVFVDPNTTYATYVLTILVTLLAGAAMALSGGIFQGSLKNALASPSTLGVTSGGSIGAILYSVFVYPNSAMAQYSGGAVSLEELNAATTPLQWAIEVYGGFICSFLGCAAIVFLIMLIAVIAGRGKVSNVALIVAGQVFTSIIALVLSWVRMWLNNHGDVESATYLAQMTSATFTGAYTPVNVALFAVPLIICMIICFCMSGKLSLLAFKDEEARSMGISTTRTRNLMVALCTIMTALVVSFCGVVGYVGLVVPYIARKLVGPDFRYLLPMCALVGAVMVTAVYYITQIGFPYLVSGSTGVVTSVIGCVTFLVIALRGRRSSGGEWL